MLLPTLEPIVTETSGSLTNPESVAAQDPVELDPNQPQPFCFQHHFTDAMLMGADVKTVSKYLDTHQGWFTRCAQPMQVVSIGRDGYALTIGKFNSFGYAVEPKIGLELLPQNSGVYRIQTIAIPDYQPPGYEVSFNAEMRLIETLAGTQLGTKVDWNLDLRVSIQFPKFIHKLPKRAIQSTGDGLLKQIVTQVSRRLTHKVQQDFHGNLGLKIPKKG
jgi:Protein of unknown function (DUF1997)